MNDNIELLKTEVDEIKKSLNELKNNITFSETEKKDKAEILNKKAETTKQKIQKEIDFLANKTDEESKKKKEEAEALLNSFNDITALYNSIINPTQNPGTQSPDQTPTENKNIFTKAKDWIKDQRNNVIDKGKWRTEGGKNLLRTAGFVATGIGALGLAYKGIKKLFGWGEDNDEDDKNQENSENTNENYEENDEENNNNEDNIETSESDKKEEKKESFWDKLYGKALAWLGIAPATGTAVAATTSSDNGSESGTNEDTEKNGSTSNETDKGKDSDSSTSKNESEDSSSKEDSSESDKPDDGKQSKEGLDNEGKTYKNSKSGRTYQIYDQCDPRRGNKVKNGGTTMKQTGCLLTSAAVIHSAIDPSITPDYYRQHYAGSHPYTSVPKATNHKIEAKALKIGSNTVEEIINHLKTGYPVNFMVHGPRHGGKNPYHKGQHYMTAVDVRGEPGKEEIFIANTYNGKGSGWYPAHKKLISVKEASLYTPNQA